MPFCHGVTSIPDLTTKRHCSVFETRFSSLGRSNLQMQLQGHSIMCVCLIILFSYRGSSLRFFDNYRLVVGFHSFTELLHHVCLLDSPERVLSPRLQLVTDWRADLIHCATQYVSNSLLFCDSGHLISNEPCYHLSA